MTFGDTSSCTRLARVLIEGRKRGGMWEADTVFGGRYTLVDRLGGGSMGEVWRCRDSVLGRMTAVKIILPALLADPEFARRFRDEAKIMAMIRHPGVADVYDYGEERPERAPAVAYVVMELIDGEPLSDLLNRVGSLSAARTMDLVAQAADALQAAHHRGVVHRDVKPSNLMLRPGGALVLTDFGIARSEDGPAATRTGLLLGSVPYLAPEAISEGRTLPAADLYALGVVAYQCLTGRLPFDGDNPAAILYAHVNEPPPPLPRDLPAAVRAVVERAMAKDPEHRWASGAALSAAAREAGAVGMAGANTGASSGADRSPAEGATPVPRRRRRSVLIGVMATALGTAAVAGTVAFSGPDPGSRTAASPPAPSTSGTGDSPVPASGRPRESTTNPSPQTSPSNPRTSAIHPVGTAPAATSLGGGTPIVPNEGTPSIPGGPALTTTPTGPTSPALTSPPPYTGTLGPGCPSTDGSSYSEAGSYTSGTHNGWYTGTSATATDQCGSEARYIPLSGTTTDSGSYIQWRFPTASIQQGSCAVSVLFPAVDPQTGGTAGLGGGASAHYEILDGNSLAVISAFSFSQSQYAGHFPQVGSFPLRGGAFVLRLVDRGVGQPGLPWPAHFAADEVRVDCVGS